MRLELTLFKFDTIPRSRDLNTMLISILRSNGVHVPHEVEVQTMLWGDFAESWTTGSNSKIIATETQKNTVYKLAQESGRDPAPRKREDRGPRPPRPRARRCAAPAKPRRAARRPRQPGGVWQAHRLALPQDLRLGHQGAPPAAHRAPSRAPRRAQD